MVIGYVPNWCHPESCTRDKDISYVLRREIRDLLRDPYSPPHHNGAVSTATPIKNEPGLSYEGQYLVPCNMATDNRSIRLVHTVVLRQTHRCGRVGQRGYLFASLALSPRRRES